MNAKLKGLSKPAMMTAAPKPSKADRAKLLALVKKVSSRMGKLDKVNLASAVLDAIGVSSDQVLYSRPVFRSALPELSEKEKKALDARVREYGKKHSPKVPRLRGTTERMPGGAVYIG